MKRLFANGLVMAILVFLVYGVAQAQPNLTLPDIIASLGDSVEIDLNFVNNGQVTSAEIEISFDPDIVSIDPDTDIEASAALDAAGFTLFANEAVEGTITLAIINLENPAALIPNGDIVLMDFSADVVGDTDLIFDAVTLGDAAAMEVPVDTLTDGSITVQEGPVLLGDVSIVKSSETKNIRPGNLVVIAYDIILDSIGEGTAEDVTVTDELPLGAEFEPDLSSENCEQLIGANTVECDVGDLAAGTAAALTISVSIVCAVPDDVLNDATVEFLDGSGQVVQNDSNVSTIRCRRTSKSSGCALASAPVDTIGGALSSLVILLIPAIAIGMRRLTTKYRKS